MKQPSFAVSPTLGGAMIAVDLPGVDEDHIEVSSTRGNIVIHGSRETSGEDYHLAILLDQFSGNERVLSHKEEGHAWILISGCADGPGCSFQLAS